MKNSGEYLQKMVDLAVTHSIYRVGNEGLVMNELFKALAQCRRELSPNTLIAAAADWIFRDLGDPKEKWKVIREVCEVFEALLTEVYGGCLDRMKLDEDVLRRSFRQMLVAKLN